MDRTGRGVVQGAFRRGATTDERQEDVFEARLLLDVLHLGRRHQRLELGERAVHEDPALVEDRDPVGELLGLVEVLRGEQDRGAAVGELADGLPHLQASLRVEAGGRLVEEDHRRAPDQAHREVETATHAARVGRHPPSPGVGEREAVEHVVGDPARLVEVPKLGDQHQVLASGEDVVDRGELSR